MVFESPKKSGRIPPTLSMPTCRPALAMSSPEKVKEPAARKGEETVPVPNIIEQVKRDSRGIEIKKRYIRGILLGKGGFAKCYQVTDTDTNIDWACKVVQKSSLVKERHKLKVRILSVTARPRMSRLTSQIWAAPKRNQDSQVALAPEHCALRGCIRGQGFRLHPHGAVHQPDHA